ncbi:hypothetical protein [Parapedobacter sp. 10938]|uniref:hypothetical protein n=1 Tax=Parapedobacter flavus TaxID=3110225 RepID=UPI002DBFB1B3|nr:hypothetical protein [Parapedobacter sp. 10938]MEC3880924.1 hypothetical protein [Parapedobacter sp. 10938]
MLSKTKRHILILYSVLAIALVTIGVGMLLWPDETNGGIHRNMESDNRTFFWEIYPELVIPNAGKVINKSLHIKDSNDSETTVEDLSERSPLLVFRYSQYDCNLCIDQVLQKLHAIYEGDEDKVCLIVDGMTGREFRLKYKNRKMNFSSYFVADDNLGLSLENKNLPFLFVLSDDARVNKVFVPFKEYPNQTDAYLKNIKAILSD